MRIPSFGGPTRRRPGLPGRGLLVAMAVVLGGVAPPAHAAAADLEAKVKAAYIYNFMSFVDWEAAGSSAAPMSVCVLGDDPVLPLLRDLSPRGVKGRPLKVAAISRLDDSTGCHLLVVARSEAERLAAILRHLAGTSVLTVSDIPRFSRLGGTIGFVTEDGRVRIEINQRAAAAAGLKISAKLLEVARLVP